MKRPTELIVPWITVLGLIFGGLYTLKEYKDSVGKEMTERTMSYLSQYNSHDMYQARTLLEKFQETNKRRIKEILLNEKNSPAENKRKYVEFTNETLSSEENAAIRMHIDFFNEIATCAEELKLCDIEKAHIIFDNKAQVFTGSFYPHICLQRDDWKWNEYGEQYEIFFQIPEEEKSCKFFKSPSNKNS